jgi:hypothetical protein
LLNTSTRLKNGASARLFARRERSQHRALS